MNVLSRLLGQTPPPEKSLELHPADLASLPATQLARLAADAAGGELQTAARQRLVELLDAGGTTPAELRGSLGNDDLQAIVGDCRSESVAGALIADITDPERLGALALRGGSPALRRLAAEKVSEPALVARLLKEAQGKDKHVYRILKSKRDAQLALERAAAEAQAALHTLCGTIERHSHQPFGESYASTVEFLAGQWQAEAGRASAELRAQAEAALARCRAVIAKHAEQAAAAAARVNALQAAAAARAELLQAVRRLYADVCAATGTGLAAELLEQQRRWQELAAVHPAGKSERAEFEQWYTAIEAQLAFNEEHGSIAACAAALDEARLPPLQRALRRAQALDDALPDAVRSADAALQAWQAARAAEREAAASAQRQAIGLLRKAQAALAAGHSRQAAGIRHALEDKLRTPGADLPAGVAAQLQAFDARLASLQDWRSYVVAPKRAELIAAMEALVGSTEPPPRLAEQIHRLQEEWKLISKGSTEDTTAEWERFHAAAQQAYEPCKQHFAAQAQQRAENLARRAALLERLEQFTAAHDWASPDWREVARALRESRQLWRGHQPVERAANKPLQERFDTLTTELQAKLGAEYERNEQARRRLIAQAEQLGGAGDGRQAAEEIKRLQAAWKELGLVPHELGQQLWEEFRRHCDAVFARRQEQQVTRNAQLSASQQQAEQLCAELEQLASQSGAELAAGMKRVPEIRAAFGTLGDLPREAVRALTRRFDRALELCERQQARQRAADQAAAWDRVLEAADAIRRYQLARAPGTDGAASDALRTAAEAQLASGTGWPKSAVQALRAALAADGTAADVPANEAALRTLCVRAELLTETPTPESDLAFRREHQLRELTRGFGQARASGRAALESLLLEWLALGPTGDAAWGAALERLQRCRQRAA